MKRKTKNATEAYTHAMAAERDKVSAYRLATSKSSVQREQRETFKLRLPTMISLYLWVLSLNSRLSRLGRSFMFFSSCFSRQIISRSFRGFSDGWYTKLFSILVRDSHQMKYLIFS